MRSASQLFALTALLALGLFSACQDKGTSASNQAAADSLHLIGSHWTDATGQISFDFVSADKVHFTFAPSGAPIKINKDLDCTLRGDSVFIEDFSKFSPAGSVTILKDFKGQVRGQELHADFTSTDPQPNPSGGHPSFVDIDLQDVVFTRK